MQSDGENLPAATCVNIAPNRYNAPRKCSYVIMVHCSGLVLHFCYILHREECILVSILALVLALVLRSHLLLCTISMNLYDFRLQNR